MMADFRWIKRDDGALCLDGYPIRIERNHSSQILPFIVVSDWHHNASPYQSLDAAKEWAKRLAVEINEFNNPEQDMVRGVD